MKIRKILGASILLLVSAQINATSIYSFDLPTGTTSEIYSTLDDIDGVAFDGRYTTWRSGGFGENGRIGLYDTQTGLTSQLASSTASSRVTNPTISQGVVAWANRTDGRGEPFQSEIVTHNIATNAQSTVVPLPGYRIRPRIDGDRIVWYEGSTRRLGAIDLVSGNTTSGTQEILPNPDVSGDLAAYVVTASFGQEIRGFNLENQTEFFISDGPAGDVRIDGDRVVWQEFVGGALGLVSHDLDTGFEQVISVNTGTGLAPKPEISMDTVIWSGVTGLMAYDYLSSSSTLIANKAGLGAVGDIVWIGSNNSYDVFGNTIVFVGDIPGLISITPCETSTITCLHIPEVSNLDADDVEAYTGTDSQLTLFYKNDFDAAALFGAGDEFGLFKDNYSTKYETDEGGEPTGADIFHDLGDKINCAECYVVVKDGRQGDPAQYLFDISDSGDLLTLALNGFWDGEGVNGSISNIAIYGVNPVPVPAAFWLFGTGLIGLVGFSKRRKAA